VQTDFQFPKRARSWQSAEFIPAVEDFENYFLTFQIGIEADITKKAKLRVVLYDDYTNQPANGRKANDIRLVTGLSYSFN
tara:strand:+ start:519 stop:758 length:240 start_codon:yes stop_codon:yes gene_type:complete